MKQLLTCCCFVSFTGIYSFGQEVKTSAGDYFESPNAKLSWTLGELMTSTFTSGPSQLTQGQQQSLFNFASIKPNEIFETVDVYPNPTIDFLTITTSNDDSFTYSISNHLGQKIANGEILKSPHQIDVSTVASGVYFVTLQSSQKQKTFKLIKH